MQTQVWILVLLAIVPEAGAADCNKRDQIFNSKASDNPKTWIAIDWDAGCDKLSPAVPDCKKISGALTTGGLLTGATPIDELLFTFKTSAIAFINANSARELLLTTKVHSRADTEWGTFQELFNCLATECSMLLGALGQNGEASKFGKKMDAECRKYFLSISMDEALDCVSAAGAVSSASAQVALNTLMTYTSQGTNVQRMRFLATLTIDPWGGTADKAIQCAGTGDCNRLPPLLTYMKIDEFGRTRFTDSMKLECAKVFAAGTNNLESCERCPGIIAAATGIIPNQGNLTNVLITEYGKCPPPAPAPWKTEFQNANRAIANWGTMTQMLSCTGFVPSSTTPAASTSTGSTGSPGSTALTIAPPNPDCLASRKELLQKAVSGEYRIIAPLVAACTARLNATEQAECTKTASAMTAIVSSTSTSDDEKLLALTTELIKFGNISSEKANIILTTDITTWGVAAGEKTYMRFITCQSQGNCELSQIMFAPLPNGESYASTKLMIACQRNNSPALCTTLMNEVKKCTQGPLNFMPATEWDRIVRAQSILSSSTTKIDANAPFGDWGTVGQFTACK